ncbi:MAG: DUF4070 domain-containing protein [Lentisphaerae bacterium]|nr:DUF4070 domain-containing protein [Lentisphaerota bacterium]
MNILLIYPKFPDTFWSFKHALEFVGKKAAFPPLGLITVAAMLPPAWNKRLVDANVRRLRDADLKWADYAFVSAMAVQRKAVLHILDQCKAAGVKVVAGGPLFTVSQELFPDVDHLVLNEAEQTLPLFLQDLERGHAKRVYTTPEFAALHQTPQPLWELLEMRRYASMAMQFSRGCPFNCDFCNVTTLFGHRVRMKSAAQITAELDRLHALGWRGEVFFVDDNFIGNKAFLRNDLLPALIAWRKKNPGILFFTEVSLNLADDPALVRQMVEAGFTKVFIGIETPNEDSLAECGKSQNRNRDLVATVKSIQRAGLQVQGGFIVGFDHDRPSIFQRQIDFIQKSGIVTAMVGLLQAPRGTRLYARLKAAGRLQGDSTGDNVDGTTNIVPVMSLETLKAGYKRILDGIYAPDPFYRRIRTFLREYNPPKVRGHFQRGHLKALLYSFFKLGLFERGRWAYWKLLFWTQFHRPRLIPDALVLAIYGYHFRKVCQKSAR